MRNLEKLLRAATPVLIWGPPGVGKSATVMALGRRLGLPVEVVIASIREPSDFSGLPVIVGEEVKFSPPSWARRLADAGKGILFLDEISTAPPAVQAALLRVVLDKAVGDLQLPSEVSIVAAANPPEIAAGGWDLSPPLANRFIHVQWKSDPSDWTSQFPTYWGDAPKVPGLDPSLWARARSMVAGFIKSRPQLLLQVPKEISKQGQAWPSPRSWDNASRAFAAYELIIEDAADAIAGAVGEGPGLEFLAWARELDLPDPEELLRDPSLFKVPKRGDQAFAILSSVAAAVSSNLTFDRWNAAWQIVEKAVEEKAADTAAVCARSLAKMRRPGWHLPTKQVTSLAPILREAGLL